MKVAQVAHSWLSILRSNMRSHSITRSHFTYYPTSLGTGKKMNMVNAINNAMDLALSDDKSALLFGEDVGFGGVFRCSVNLRDKYGKERVFNSPLCEQGIAGHPFPIHINILLYSSNWPETAQNVDLNGTEKCDKFCDWCS
ncbi:2-oxoisovalerate dehydrogenase subunit beta, mitochondrial isoform X5 [Drosophila rhopaloa]|uniref:Transketolase-like pyrimidine-binding domain-containing protein n=1 Tax=Drosophila rhopaloa TaxID=1041015 RepID=A0ABM5J121_DRORH|nr:2-oxoisovalerate dehydrogenase subunit beta, mitochondrial isoform X5 [Drosophila rhopaloa]